MAPALDVGRRRRSARGSGSAARRSRVRAWPRRRAGRSRRTDRSRRSRRGWPRALRYASRRSTLVPQSVSLIGCPSSQLKARLKNLLPSRLAKRIARSSIGYVSRTPLTNSPLSERMRLVEARQILGRHGQVGVEDHQDVAGRLREAQAHGIALAAPGLPQQPARCAADWRRSRARWRRRCRPTNGLRRRSAPCPRPSRACARRSRGCCPLRCVPARRPRPATEPGPANRPASGRASRKFASARWRRPHSRTSTRLQSGATPGSGSGQQDLLPRTDHPKSLRCSRFVTS